MGNGQITTRELFQKLLDVVEGNHKVQEAHTAALVMVHKQLIAIEDLLSSRMWTLLIVLIGALCAAVGIKLAFPGT